MINKNKKRIFRFNRRNQGKTDYNLRLRLLKSGLTRMVVRKSNGGMMVSFSDYKVEGDKLLTSARAQDLKSFGNNLHGGNIVSAYLTGYLAGKRAVSKGLKSDVVVDFGLQKVMNGNRLYAAVKGAVDAGVKVRVSEEVFPAEDRLNGEHLNKEGVDKVIDSVKKEIDKKYK